VGRAISEARHGGTGGDREAVVRHNVGRNGDARWCARIVAVTEGEGIFLLMPAFEEAVRIGRVGRPSTLMALPSV
jgi:hypothetical protein